MNLLAPEININLQEKQTMAYESIATEQLYGGGTYGGKSHLMRCAAIAWCALIPGLQVYLFRREFPDLYKNHMEGPTSFPMLLQPWINAGWARINYGKNYIEFWNNSKIHLCHCQHEKDMYGFDGAEIHVLMIDELTHFTETIYRYLRARCRLGGLQLPEEWRGRFPKILCGTNPGGVGHNWVKQSFINIQPPYHLMRMPPEEGGMLRQFIPALATDNPVGLTNDPDYMVNQAGLGDSALVKAKRDGDWDIVAGGALDDVWSRRVIVPRFPVPRQWRVDRSFDWGSTHPFSVLWFAEADGTEARYPMNDGTRRSHVFCPPKRSIIVSHEWYGGDPKKSNVGLKKGARWIADGINEREKLLMEGKWFSSKPLAGPADNQIDAQTDPDASTLKRQMEDRKVYWTESNKSPGSRKIGLDTVRDMILEAGKDKPEDPSLFIMDHCRNLLSHLPVLPRDPKNPDDVDSSAEDHDYDALRYRVLGTRRVTSVGPLKV
jgi:hypothetical protein